MRQAVDAVNSSGNWTGPKYCMIGHNCQNWADAVRKKYKELQKQQKKDKNNNCNN